MTEPAVQAVQEPPAELLWLIKEGVQMKYAIVENGVCVNVIMARTDFAASIGAVELPDGYGIGDTYTDGVWSHPEPPEPEPTAADDLEAMAIDHEYRLTLLELGL